MNRRGLRRRLNGGRFLRGGVPLGHGFGGLGIDLRRCEEAGFGAALALAALAAGFFGVGFIGCATFTRPIHDLLKGVVKLLGRAICQYASRNQEFLANNQTFSGNGSVVFSRVPTRVVYPP